MTKMEKNMRALLVLFILLSMQAAYADDLYRWVDKDGQVHYSDTPHPDDADKVNLSVFGKAASGVDANLPYQTRQVMKTFPVTLYTFSSCTDPCSQARDFLRKHHIPFTEKMLKSQEEINAFKEQSGSNTVPTLSVGKDWLQGFQEQEWQNELDAVGYPK
jgi:glutaredoxin